MGVIGLRIRPVKICKECSGPHTNKGKVCEWCRQRDRNKRRRIKIARMVAASRS